MYSICITGHKPDKLPGGYNRRTKENIKLFHFFRDYLISKIEEHKELICYSGLNLGTEQIFAIAVIDLKSKDYNIKLKTCLSNNLPESDWSKEDKETFDKILPFCDEINKINDNNYFLNMIKQSDEVLSFWNGSAGTTAQNNYIAHTLNKPIFFINTFYLTLGPSPIKFF